MIGASRETVTRLFAIFKRKKLVGVHGQRCLSPTRLASKSFWLCNRRASCFSFPD
jgi:hypothetical protein